MPDTRKSSDRPRQVSFRLGSETERQIADLQEALFEADALRRPVSATDVLRLAIREYHRSYCTSQKKSKKSAERD